MEHSERSLAPAGVSSHNPTGLLWDQSLEMTQGKKHEPLLFRGASAFVCINTYNDAGNSLAAVQRKDGWKVGTLHTTGQTVQPHRAAPAFVTRSLVERMDT